MPEVLIDFKRSTRPRPSRLRYGAGKNTQSTPTVDRYKLLFYTLNFPSVIPCGWSRVQWLGTNGHPDNGIYLYSGI